MLDKKKLSTFLNQSQCGLHVIHKEPVLGIINTQEHPSTTTPSSHVNSITRQPLDSLSHQNIARNSTSEAIVTRLLNCLQECKLKL